MSAPTSAVTGATSGIGKAIAEALARAGHRVALVCRDRARGEALAAALGGGATAIIADLREKRGWEAAARGLLDACPRLDVLVHNAGLWPSARVLTGEGLEESFAINHMAPFVLNHLLAARLAESGARVVQVSAGLAAAGRVDLDRTPIGADFHRLRTYANTKRANLVATLAWADRVKGITVNAVHPGVVRTGLGDSRGLLGMVLRLVKRAWWTPEQGAAAPVWLATDPSLSGTTGRYFHLRDPREIPDTRDPALARALWEKSAALAGLDAPW